MCVCSSETKHRVSITYGSAHCHLCLHSVKVPFADLREVGLEYDSSWSPNHEACMWINAIGIACSEKIVRARLTTRLSSNAVVFQAQWNLSVGFNDARNKERLCFTVGLVHTSESTLFRTLDFLSDVILNYVWDYHHYCYCASLTGKWAHSYITLYKTRQKRDLEIYVTLGQLASYLFRYWEIVAKSPQIS